VYGFETWSLILQKKNMDLGFSTSLFYTMYEHTPKFCNILNYFCYFVQLNNSMMQSHSWKTKSFSDIQKNSPDFIDAEGLLPRSQEPDICPSPEPE
jgi:hypothetical protein